MKLVGGVAIIAMALSGCAAERLWQPKDEPPRAADDGAPPFTSAPQSPLPHEDRAFDAAKAPPKSQAPPDKRAPLLVAGITAYDDGKYAEAAKALRGALATRLEKPDQIAAHKYLAFIECSTGRRSQCREEFRKALRIDPSFDLEPAEAGHPVWGPIFRGLKPKPKKR
jgi:hypothetical protein